jgi:hypothetical protein
MYANSKIAAHLNMTKLIRLFTGASILLAIFTPVDSTAKTKSHKIGYVRELGGIGECSYWLLDDKKKFVFNEYYPSKLAYMNIDGKEVELYLTSRQNIKRKGKQIGSIDKYKSNAFQVNTHFTDISTAKDKKSSLYRTRGDLIIKDSDGSQKRLRLECVTDIGG